MGINRYLNEVQTAELLGVSVHTLRNWRFRRKNLKFIILGERSIRYSLEDIVSFAESRKIEIDR